MIGMATLTESMIRELEPGEKPRFYGDDFHGLRLLVKRSKRNPSGSKSWAQRIVIQGKRRDIGLGGWPLVSLDEARSKALENRRTAKRGGDPTETGKTFWEVATEHYQDIDPNHKTHQALNLHAKAALGSLPVADVRTSDVLQAIKPIWRDKEPTARKVLSAVETVFDFALALEYRNRAAGNPAESKIVRAGLPKQQRSITHREALPYSEVAGALAKVDASTAMGTVKAMIRFVALTATRVTEAREARWDEVDLHAKLWTIPADRMKTKREHRVPLSGAACEILAKQLTLRPKDCEHIFARSTGKLLSDRTARALFASLGLGNVHGLRSSFRDWASENTSEAREVLEQCLAHVTGSATERAYARTDLLAKRRAVMEAWAEYLAR